MHSGDYSSASEDGLHGKAVLVVGCGNSGMEIALDLAEAGAAACIVVRGEVHLITKQIMSAASALFSYLPVWAIDKVVLLMCHVAFGGDTAKHGLRRPAAGPFARKLQSNVYPVIDVGTYGKIKSGEIQVLPAMNSVHGDVVEFADGRRLPFDAIVFATGYRSAAKKWLKSDDDDVDVDVDGLIGDDGAAPRRRSPRAGKGLYRAGLAGRGIYGSGTDAEFIAEDISSELRRRRRSSAAGADPGND